MSKIEVDAIDKQSGSTLTLGGSGTAVTLASGATQSGFGREGSVDWQTGSIKTATFTAASGEGYFCNTSGGAFTVNLPSSPSAGNIVAVSDYANTFASNNLTVGRGGSNIEGAASDLVLDATGLAMTFVYVDATKGWKVVGAGREADKTAAEFITATGGTITTSGDYKIHTFTGPGTFCVSAGGNISGSNKVDYMVVGGGGSGGCGRLSATCSSGGGGAGGWRASSGAASGCYTAGPGPLTSPVSALPVSVQAYPITVGAGGAAAASTVSNNGSPSIFSTITSTGGGGGGSGGASQGPENRPGNPGGSGGGIGGGDSVTGAETVGAGNTPPVSPPQGNNGGGGTPANGFGGGGGATAVGGTGTGPTASRAGGAGATSCISASPVAYAGGGGAGGSSNASTGGNASPCGTGGRGGNHPAASPSSPTSGTSGTTNRGGGGGGMGSACTSATSGAGGSGVVIIRYKFQ